jgi:hypothetical protein
MPKQSAQSKMKLVKVYKKSGNKVVETTKVAELTPAQRLEQWQIENMGKAKANTAFESAKDKLKRETLEYIAAYQASHPKTGQIRDTGIKCYSGGQEISTAINPRFTISDTMPKIESTGLDLSGVPLTLEQLNAIQEPAPKAHLSTEQAMFVVSQGYYLLYVDGKAFIQSTGKEQLYPNNLVKRSKNDSGVMVSFDNDNDEDDSLAEIITTNDMLDPVPTQLTRAEFDNIVKAKPSYKQILAAYRLYENTEKVQMNFATALPVF